jgi:hypothetical protein
VCLRDFDICFLSDCTVVLFALDILPAEKFHLLIIQVPAIWFSILNLANSWWKIGCELCTCIFIMFTLLLYILTL